VNRVGGDSFREEETKGCKWKFWKGKRNRGEKGFFRAGAKLGPRMLPSLIKKVGKEVSTNGFDRRFVNNGKGEELATGRSTKFLEGRGAQAARGGFFRNCARRRFGMTNGGRTEIQAGG